MMDRETVVLHNNTSKLALQNGQLKINRQFSTTEMQSSSLVGPLAIFLSQLKYDLEHPVLISCDSQLLVSFATAMIPIGCWGMSARRTFMSPPTYLSARNTARRTQSVQKIQSP